MKFAPLYGHFSHFFKLVFLIIALTPLATHASQAQTRSITHIHKVYIDSTINPATYNYLSKVAQKIEKSSPEQAVMLIEMDTPGGLVTTTKDILTLFGKSSFPSIVWIRPEGGSATSAGALIAAGAHYIFMSEGTNIGAATPIEMSGNIGGAKPEQSDLRSKAINDLVALVQSLSELRQRNGEMFAEMITKASSFTAHQAKEGGLINGLANLQSELTQQLDNTPVRLQGQDYLLKVSSNVQTIEHPMDVGQRILNTFAHPSMAYVLFLIGAALLYLELQAPGGFVAGSIGAICLVLAAIGLQVLPLNMGALGLIILSFILFILEIFVTSFGLLSLAGFASLIFGSLFLYRTEDSYITFSISLIAASVGAIASFLGICLYYIMRDHKNIGRQKFNSQDNKVGEIVDILEEVNDSSGKLYFYQIKIGGEFWKAKSHQSLNKEEKVHTIKHSLETETENSEMILTIERI